MAQRIRQLISLVALLVACVLRERWEMNRCRRMEIKCSFVGRCVVKILPPPGTFFYPVQKFLPY